MPSGGRSRAVEEAEEEAANVRDKVGGVRTLVAEGGGRDLKTGRFIGKGQKKASEGGTKSSAGVSHQVRTH
jgi:hypothetical protein